MKAILNEGQGLGINGVAQWTFHKWCLITSVTTVFLLILNVPCRFPINLVCHPARHLAYVQIVSAFACLAGGYNRNAPNSRRILAVYVLLLFPAFISYVPVGYVTYKMANVSLDSKFSEAWHLWYSRIRHQRWYQTSSITRSSISRADGPRSLLGGQAKRDGVQTRSWEIPTRA